MCVRTCVLMGGGTWGLEVHCEDTVSPRLQRGRDRKVARGCRAPCAQHEPLAETGESGRYLQPPPAAEDSRRGQVQPL